MDFRIFFVPLPVGLICLARRFKPLCIYISFLLDLFFCPLESFHYLLESFYYPLESCRYLRRLSFPDFTRHFLLLLSETVDSFFMPY